MVFKMCVSELGWEGSRKGKEGWKPTGAQEELTTEG